MWSNSICITFFAVWQNFCYRKRWNLLQNLFTSHWYKTIWLIWIRGNAHVHCIIREITLPLLHFDISSNVTMTQSGVRSDINFKHSLIDVRSYLSWFSINWMVFPISRVVIITLLRNCLCIQVAGLDLFNSATFLCQDIYFYPLLSLSYLYSDILCSTE
jgi:hypothetical protein